MIRPPYAKGNRGFSLVELLVALTIMGILSALAVSSVSSLGSTGLSASGNQMVDVFAMARQNAMSKDDFTGVVILTSGTSACAAYCLIELPNDPNTGSRATDWSQLSAWRYLPKGIVFEDDQMNLSSSVMSATSLWSALTNLTPSGNSALLTNFPFQASTINLTSSGTPATAIVECYQPDGTLMGGASSLALTLIRGTASSTGTTTISGGTNSTTSRPKDYYDLYFVANSGTTKIGRP